MSYFASNYFATGAVAVQPSTGSDLSLHRGDTWRQAITGLGSLAGRSRLWVTCKRSRSHIDAQAVFQVEETDGLLVLEGAEPEESTWGVLEVQNASTGSVLLTLSAEATALMTPTEGAFFDVKISAGSVQTLRQGALAITDNVTDAID